jgi:hypothetical protein
VTIESIIKSREISEVLHFTTSNGLVGIMSAGSLLSHAELPKEQRLSHILQLNCPDRSRDAAWHSYVNLSISQLNGSFFSIARNRWHATKDVYWCVLSFDPEIMTHNDVYFSTTNNAYMATLRGQGKAGLEALFADKVRLFPNKVAARRSSTQVSHTTCNQAEVLYPVMVPLDFLRKIYVPSSDIYHEVEAQVEFCAPGMLEKFEVIVAPEHFE